MRNTQDFIFKFLKHILVCIMVQILVHITSFGSVHHFDVRECNGCVPRELAKILSPSREHRLTCYTYRAQYDSNYWFDKKESGIEGFESSSTGTETIPARFQQCLCTSVSGGISFALTPAPRHPSTVHSPHVSSYIASENSLPGMVPEAC